MKDVGKISLSLKTNCLRNFLKGAKAKPALTHTVYALKTL